jgi:PRC-barrel domain
MASGSEEETTATKNEEENAESQQDDERGDSQGEDERGESQGEERGESQGDASGSSEEDDGESAEGDGDGSDDDERSSEDDGDKASMAGAIEDVSSLPGETINDQDGRKVGEVKEVYGTGDDETPMWVTIESSTGLGRSRQLFVPLARIKRQGEEIRIPYSFDHLHEAPEVEPGDELSEEDDHALRVYYAIGLADQELVENAQSYASQVPDDDDPARKIDASSAEGPVREIDDAPPAQRAAEAYEKQREEQGEEEHRSGRKATADEVFEEDGDESGDEKDSDESEGEAKGSDDSDSEEKEEPKGSGESKDGESKDGESKDEESKDDEKDEKDE